jgi:predicted nucleic acid-binding protein
VEVHRISRYQFKQTDKLFFDANIWLFLYGPQYGVSTDPRVEVYSKAYRAILATPCRLYIDALVLSEVVNTIARFRFNSLPKAKRPTSFKAYRNSQAFKPIAKEIADACRRILKECIRIDTVFSTLDIKSALDRYEKGSCDFNDLILAEICKSKKLKLVTDDGDMKTPGPIILTENHHLLK